MFKRLAIEVLDIFEVMQEGGTFVCCIYAVGFSSETLVTPDATEPLSSGDAWQDREGNFLYRAALYLGWLQK